MSSSEWRNEIDPTTPLDTFRLCDTLRLCVCEHLSVHVYAQEKLGQGVGLVWGRLKGGCGTCQELDF